MIAGSTAGHMACCERRVDPFRDVRNTPPRGRERCGNRRSYSNIGDKQLTI
jgi:hypothetical protein